MKKLLILASTALFCACGNPNAYTIQGEVKDAKTVYLTDNNQHIVDSVAVVNGKYEFKGEIETPDMYTVTDQLPTGQNVWQLIVLEPGQIAISEEKVSGTPSNDGMYQFGQKADELSNEYRNQETTDQRREEISTEFEQLIDNSIEQNHANFFGLYLFAQQKAMSMSAKEILNELSLFPEKLQKSSIALKVKEYAEASLKTEIGEKMIEVAQQDKDGKEISLKATVENPANKYVLLDFWASWCGPCMGEVPHLKAAYEKYHAKGFEIYGVSLDVKKEDWVKCVKENQMNWIHVASFGQKNQAAEDYSVRGIPSNFLFDQNGVIVAKNLRGEALVEKLEELLGK